MYALSSSRAKKKSLVKVQFSEEGKRPRIKYVLTGGGCNLVKKQENDKKFFNDSVKDMSELSSKEIINTEL